MSVWSLVYSPCLLSPLVLPLNNSAADETDPVVTAVAAAADAAAADAEEEAVEDLRVALCWKE